MLSLAPLKYRNIMCENGGPIGQILWSPARVSYDLWGYEASCHLKSDLRPINLIQNKLYGNPDGTGCDKYKSLACYKAISESLERWAYYVVGVDMKSELYGFQIDSSTNGMSAFPGFTKKYARKTAQLEALERWALVEWWNGKLRSLQFKINNISFIEILIPGACSVVISWTPVTTLNKVIAYGFAAAETTTIAFKKSQVELYRNIFVLERYASNSKLVEVSDLIIQEQRLIWFSNEVGHQCFLNQVNRSLRSSITNPVPNLILDTEIIGPWSEYTTVWRCLFESSISHQEHDQEIDFFYF